MDKRIQAALLFILAIFIFMAGTKYGDIITHNKNADTQELILEKSAGDIPSKQESTIKIEAKVIKIHVSGAVKNPGIYQLDSQARINDAVQLALPLEDADINLLNLAEKLRDGQKIVVPAHGETVQNQATINQDAGSMDDGEALININTASAQELDLLPGIGPAYAERIIEYRNANGPFENPEDIQNVAGIGPKKFENIKERITVN